MLTKRERETIVQFTEKEGIEKGIITTDMKYIRNDTYEPLVRKFQYRDFDIIGIPNLMLYRILVHRLSRYKDGISEVIIVQFTEKEGIV